MRRYIIIIFLIVMAGCGGYPHATIENIENGEHDFIDLPPMAAIIDGKTYELEKGNYKIEEKVGQATTVTQTDALSPYQIAEHVEPIVVDVNSGVEFKVDGKPKITVYEWNEAGRIKEVSIKKKRLEIPDEAGYYIYEVFGEWRNAEVSYTLVINVE